MGICVKAGKTRQLDSQKWQKPPLLTPKPNFKSILKRFSGSNNGLRAMSNAEALRSRARKPLSIPKGWSHYSVPQFPRTPAPLGAGFWRSALNISVIA